MSNTEKPFESPFEAAKGEETVPLLQSAVMRSSRLQCWSGGQKHSYTTRIVKVNEASGVVSISVSKEEPGGDIFEKALYAEGISEVMFSLHLPTDVIFFKGEIRLGSAGFFNARVKTPIFKVQRRVGLRLPVPGNAPVILTLPGGRTIRTSLINLSEGGIGVGLRSKSDFELLETVSDPLMVTFEAFKIPIQAKAAIRHRAEVGSGTAIKVYRLGMAFTEIDSSLQTRLSQLVYEESAKYLGRFSART
jgi:hypothetical protein